MHGMSTAVCWAWGGDSRMDHATHDSCMQLLPGCLLFGLLRCNPHEQQ